jgi:hypothetical protein
MTEQPLQVDVLKKVSLTMQAGTTPELMNVISEPYPYHFIFGLGVNGLSPLEVKLSHKKIGEEVIVALDAKELHYAMHQHNLPLSLPAEDHNGIYMKIRIDMVSDPEQREVIKGLADQTSCHDCDCGCGGH